MREATQMHPTLQDASKAAINDSSTPNRNHACYGLVLHGAGVLRLHLNFHSPNPILKNLRRHDTERNEVAELKKVPFCSLAEIEGQKCSPTRVS